MNYDAAADTLSKLLDLLDFSRDLGGEGLLEGLPSLGYYVNLASAIYKRTEDRPWA